MTKVNPQRFRVVRTVLDAPEMAAIIRRMAGELIERRPKLDEMMLVGIRTRGVPLAEAIHDAIEAQEGTSVPVGSLDITLYRDDLSTVGPQPLVKGTNFPVPVEDRLVVLCDDVLYTGRTVRAALDELTDYGRPRAVRLAVLIDRGHRELPIQADVVGRAIETAAEETVAVGFTGVDDGDYVRVLEPVGGEEAS